MENFGMLPSDITLDIFSRLPTESVLESKSVSKTWNTVLQTPSFNQLHFNHQKHNLDSGNSGKLGIVFLSTDDSNGTRQFSYVDYDENSSDNGTPSHTVKKMNLNPLFKVYSFVGSCNGLICLNGLPAHYTFHHIDRASYVAYICNPVTGESVTLPEMKRACMFKDSVFFYVIGFGYVPSTNEYKVVRLYKFRREPKVAHIEVYTLGSGKGWRNEGKKINLTDEMKVREHGTFANGCIYWNFGKGRIVAFDLADEMFVELPKFSELKAIENGYRLGILGDCLCAIAYSAAITSDVWLFKKKQGESLMSWSKGFSLTDMDDGQSTPVALTVSGRVLCFSYTKLHLYDLKSSSTKLLVDFDRPLYHAFPHRNTLLSLMALGEKTQQTLETVESAIDEQ